MFPAPKKLGSANFGASTFFASAHPSESCGSNGLPLTPNSIRIFGRARSLYLINHPNLCSYIDIIRGKHERIIVVKEYYPLNLKDACKNYDQLRTEESLVFIANQSLHGLVYLNRFGTVCGNLSPETILIDPKGQVKLYGYGMYYMTEAGSAISFPIGSCKYLPPELLVRHFSSEGQQNISSVHGHPAWDTWSLGIILLEMLLGITLFENDDTATTIEKLLTMASSGDNILNFLVDTHNSAVKFKNFSLELQDFLRQSLLVDSGSRPKPDELIKHRLFAAYPSPKDPIMPHFPTIDPSLCIVDISQYKTRLGLYEDNYKNILEDYPHNIKKDSDKDQSGINPWRYLPD